jgi:RNA polymerase sigma-70 factor (ECF subfamily)
VIGLRDVEGLGAGEVAAALDISAGNERVILHRARSRLRRELEDYFGR